MTDPVPIIACALIALGIGSNDTSNALGICIGCGIIRFRRAVLVFGCLVLIGVMVQGQKVMNTVGRDIVEVDHSILSISLAVSALLIIVSNLKKLPLSTNQVIIGSLTGSGVASRAKIDLLELGEIAVSWLVSPLVAFLFAFLLYKAMEKTLSKLPLFQIEKILRLLLLLSGLLIAYNTGANELATILGPAVYSGLLEKTEGSLFGALFVFVGAFFLSKRVIETVGKGITSLDPFSGFAAQFGAGISVLLFTFLGMPVSTTYCIIGAISGVGFLKGMETVRTGLIRKILANWVIAPSSAFVICFAVMKFLK